MHMQTVESQQRTHAPFTRRFERRREPTVLSVPTVRTREKSAESGRNLSVYFSFLQAFTNFRKKNRNDNMSPMPR